MGCAEYKTRAGRKRSQNAQLLMFLLAEFLRVGFLGSGGFDGLGLVRALTGIDVALCVFDVGVFAQLGEIGAESGLQFLVVERVLNFGKYVLQRRNTGHLVIDNLQDHVALLGANHVGDGPGLHGKSLVLDSFVELATLEHAKRAAVGGRRTVRIFLGYVFKAGAIVDLFGEIMGLGLGSLARRFVVGGLSVRSSGSRRVGISGYGRRGWSDRWNDGFGRNQDLTQANVLRLFHLALVVVVKLLLLLFADSEVAPDLLANHLLGDDLVAHVLLEVFPGDALLGRLLLEVLKGLKLHVFAHLVQALDEIGVAGNAEVFPFVEQKLLVDKIAEDVFFTIGVGFVGIFGVLLLDLVLELILAAFKLRTGDDLVVDAGNDLFDDLSGLCDRKCGQTGQSNKNQGKFLHRIDWAATLPGLADKSGASRFQHFTPLERARGSTSEIWRLLI